MREFPNKNFDRWAPAVSLALIILGLAILGKIYQPLLKEEISYQLSKNEKKEIVSKASRKEKNDSKETGIKEIVPVDQDFSLVVPKISANAKVIADVSPQDSREYQKALTLGVAHAKGTAYPGEDGNVFIFAHSGVDFAEAARYNAIFYLLSKLEKGDEMTVFYKGKRFDYSVEEKKTVGADEVRYLKGDENKKTLTLMTCWPAGTTFKRLVVVGNQK